MTEETQTKGETTRLAIEDAAVNLFMEHGYHATSMRQIAERLGWLWAASTIIFPAKRKSLKALLWINIHIKKYYL